MPVTKSLRALRYRRGQDYSGHIARATATPSTTQQIVFGNKAIVGLLVNWCSTDDKFDDKFDERGNRLDWQNLEQTYRSRAPKTPEIAFDHTLLLFEEKNVALAGLLSSETLAVCV